MYQLVMNKNDSIEKHSPDIPSYVCSYVDDDNFMMMLWKYLRKP